MKTKLTIIPKVSIHPNRINLYNENHWDPSPPTREKSILESKWDFDKNGNIVENPQYRINHIINSNRKSMGIVSKNAAKKMNDATEYLILMANEKSYYSQVSGRNLRFKIAFATLTLPSTQIHDDKEIISKCLNQFLIEIKKYYKVRNYIWRAEKQKNGNIHFHILVDKFIPHQELRDRWNRIINKLGYIDNYREQQKTWHSNGFRPRPELYQTWSKEKQYKAYLRGAKTHWQSPNSTDIHSVQKIHNIKSYLTKYMTKQETQFKIKGTDIEIPIYQTGRIWGCNYDLSKVTGARTEVDNTLGDELNQLLNDQEVYKFEGDYFTVIYIDYTQLQARGLEAVFRCFADYMYQRFDFPLNARIAA